MDSNRIVQEILHANPARSPDCLRRRLLKILEELGEGCEAYLSRTGSSNYKNKTWADYREEGCDTLIVMLDVALTEIPNVNWPPTAYLDLFIKEGFEQAVTNFDDMEAVKFDVARAVCSADYALRQEDNQIGFYGAIGRGVKAAAKLCYARIPQDNNDELEERVFAVIQEKLEKWKGRSTAKVPEPVVVAKPVKPFATTQGDMKSYIEDLQDRQL